MTKIRLSEEDQKYIKNQIFIGVIEDLGLSVHRIKNPSLTRIEILGIEYNQKKLYTSTFLCLEDKDVDKLISLLQESKNK